MQQFSILLQTITADVLQSFYLPIKHPTSY